MSSLRLLTLNIEGHKHLDRWLPIVKNILPDAVCLQEIFAADLPRIEQELSMSSVFVPMSDIQVVNRYKIHPLGHWGIAQLTSLPTRNVQKKQYGGGDMIPVFHKPNDSQRMVLFQEIKKSERWFPIATTHFTWSPEGEYTTLQQEDFGRLAEIIRFYPELVLCGDFNAPRGKELFSHFSDILEDRLPKNVTTTIDKDLHYAGDLHLVVDAIFSTPNLQVTNVQTISGVSDHMGVVGEVEKDESKSL